MTNNRPSFHPAGFYITILLISLLAMHVAIHVNKGGVWENHLADGLIFLKGKVPYPPSYPIWGYSLLAGIFGNKILFVELTLLLYVLGYWYSSILSITKDHSLGFVQRILHTPVVLALFLTPFIFLSVSFFSNSIAYMLAFTGVWRLYLAVDRNEPLVVFFISGLLFGIGFNIRSEVLYLGLVVAMMMPVYQLISQRMDNGLIKSLVFVFGIGITTIPWLIYTNETVGTPSFGASNGGGVIYMSLGIVPNNPWNILDSDEYLNEVAVEKNLGSPWSITADNYFKQESMNAIQEHPDVFIKRIFLGWKQFATQGLYFPSIREYLSEDDSRDKILIDFLNENIKLALGLNVNEREWKEYQNMELSIEDLSVRHYIIVISEYLLRLIFASLFLLLIATGLILSLKTRFQSFASYLFLATFGFQLLIAGFLVMVPRIATLFLPISLAMVVVLFQFDNRVER